jgi:uncharacterized protein
MNNRVTHFEIQADNIERAVAFYTNAFGWTLTKWENPGAEYWLIMTAEKGSTEPGINGGLLKRPAPAPGQPMGTNAYVCTIQVDNFDEVAQKIEASGGIVAMPKFAMPGMAWQGYFLDTEGNTFGLHQTDPNAK